MRSNWELWCDACGLARAQVMRKKDLIRKNLVENARFEKEVSAIFGPFTIPFAL